MDIVVNYGEINSEKFWHKKFPENSAKKTLKILECPTLSDAHNLLAQNWFKQEIQNISLLNDISFVINESASKIKLQRVSIDKNILISFESSTGDNYAVFWKASDNCHAIDLSKFDDDLKKFVRSHLKNSMEKDERGIFPSENNLEQSISLLSDHRGFNLLMLVLDQNQVNIASILIALGQFNVNYKVNETSAIDLAWRAKNFDIVLDLLNANSCFPLAFNQVDASDEIQIFVKTCSKLHNLINNYDAIDSTKVCEISQIIDENKHLRYFFNDKNQSAAFAALTAKNLDIYGLLASKNVVVHPNEDLTSILDALPEENQTNLRDIHKKFSHSILKKYLLKIYINCFFGLDDFECENHWQKIIEAFEILDKNVDIQPLLELVGNAEKFKIFFDFHRDRTEFLDPTSSDADGKFYFSGIIYIAAKKLLDESTRNAATGVLAHELCHFAMHLTYRNNAKPYAVCNSKAEIDFKRILKDCYRNQNNEEIIRLVFEFYNKSEWHAELIVRTPHILAHYEQHLNTVQHLLLLNSAPFRNLYDFYKNQVIPHVLDATPVYAKMTDNLNSLKWVYLTSQLQAKIKVTKINFQGAETTLLEMIGENSKAYDELSSDQLMKLINSEKINISKEVKDNNEIFIERKFVEKSIYDEKFKNPLTAKEIAEINQNILNHSKSFDDFMRLRDHVVLLSDYAGAGKTTSLSKIAIKLKLKFKEKWLQYIDLKSYVKAFSNLKSQELEPHEVLTFLSSKMLSLNKLEEEIFKQLFANGEIIFIFDGIDEISPDYNKIVMRLLKSLNDNQVWIGTRPKYANEIEKEFKIKSFKFLAFSQQERTKFFKMFFEKQNLTGKEFNERMRVAEIIVQRLEENSNLNKFKDVGNPLIIKMIADESFEQNMTKKINFFTIFESFFKKKSKVFGKKGKVVTEQFDKFFNVLISVSEVHQLYALRLIFAKNFQNLKIHKRKNSWTHEQINRYGILHIDSNEHFNFAHRNFAEFFCAKYLIENIFGCQEVSDNEARARLNLLFESNSEILGFIDNYIDLTLLQERENFDETIKKLMITEFKDILKVKLNSPSLKLNIIRVLTRFFRSSDEIIEALWMLNENENLLIYSLRNLFLVDDNKLKSSEKIYEIAKKYLKGKELQKLMDSKNQSGNILYNIMKSYRRVSFDCKLLKMDERGILNILTSSTFGEFFVKVKSHISSSDMKEMIFSNSPEIFSNVFTSSSEMLSVWREIQSILSKDEFKRALATVDESGETVLCILSGSLKDNYDPFFKIIEETFTKQEIFNLFILNDKKEINLVSKLIINYSQSKFDTFWSFIERNTSWKNMKKLFLDSNRLKMSILHHSLNCSNPELFALFLKKYKKCLIKDELRKLFLVEPSSKHQFHYFVDEPSPEPTQRAFFKFFTNLFLDDKKMLKEIIVQKTLYGYSIFDFFESKNDILKLKSKTSVLLKFVEILKKITSEEEFKILEKELEIKKLNERKVELENVKKSELKEGSSGLGAFPLQDCWSFGDIHSRNYTDAQTISKGILIAKIPPNYKGLVSPLRN